MNRTFVLLLVSPYEVALDAHGTLLSTAKILLNMFLILIRGLGGGYSFGEGGRE